MFDVKFNNLTQTVVRAASDEVTNILSYFFIAYINLVGVFNGYSWKNCNILPDIFSQLHISL